MSSHVRFLHARFFSRSGVSPQGRFPSAPLGSLGFATQPQARQDTRPNRVPFVRTDSLAFRCSPPRLRATQLQSAFNQSSVWLSGLPPPLQVRSRAHDCGSLLPPSHPKGGGKPPQSKALTMTTANSQRCTSQPRTRSAQTPRASGSRRARGRPQRQGKTESSAS